MIAAKNWKVSKTIGSMIGVLIAMAGLAVKLWADPAFVALIPAAWVPTVGSAVAILAIALRLYTNTAIAGSPADPATKQAVAAPTTGGAP